MKKIISYFILNIFFSFYAIAGDYAGGKSLYSVDLSEKFTTYKMNKKDKKWVSSFNTLAKKSPRFPMNQRETSNPRNRVMD